MESNKPIILEQKSNSFETILIIVLMLITVLMIMSPQLFRGQAFSKNDIIALIVISIVTLMVTFLLIQSKLTVILDKDTIQYKLSPFQFSFTTISKEQIDSVKVESINPISDLGGWGIRYYKKGIAYLVSGNTVINIKKTTGRHILLGISAIEEVKVFLEQYYNDKINV